MSASLMEKRLFQHSFDDGWLDVLIGIGVTATGFLWLTGIFALGAVVPAVLFPFWKIGRKSLIEPRLGQVRFRAARSEETRRNLTGWFLFGAAVLLTELAVLLALDKLNAPRLPGMSDIAVAIPVWLVAVGLLAGLMIGARRFLVYAAGAGAIGIAGIVIGVDEPAHLILAAGLIVLGSGGILLVRFLRAFPMPKEPI